MSTSYIPSQLDNTIFRFIKVREDKRPMEEEWTTKNNYLCHESDFLSFVEKNKRYGVVTGYGDLIVIDFDNLIVQQEVEPKLPETFTVKTAGRGLHHLYFIVDKAESFKVLDINKDTLADVQGEGKQVIGPGSILNGKTYEIVKDLPIAETKLDFIKNAFGKYLNLETEARKTFTSETDDDCKQIKSQIKVPDILSSYGIDISKNPTACPFHNSKGGKCFSFNDEVWHCFHCEQKGNIFHLVMQKEGIEFFEAKQKLADRIGLKINNKKNVGIFELLDDEDNNRHYLDQGCNGIIFWYGKNLKGKETLICSDGRTLRNTLEKFKDQIIGTNEIKDAGIEYDGYIGDIGPVITNETIKRYITKKTNGDISGLINPEKLYCQIRDKILYYMDFAGKDEIADVLACWIIATYCYQIFYWFPHIIINAPSGSGKSKCLFIVLQLSFRGFDIGASAGATPAQIFRTIEGNRGTLGFDEFEQVDNDIQKLINQILNASATKDAYVIRTEQIDKKWKSWKFPIYCPKAVANISGINPTSLTRFIAFQWLKTNNKEKGSRKPYREEDKKGFEPIRNDCHILILENWEAIKKIYDGLHIVELQNREEDNWLPLFAIARFIDQSQGSQTTIEEKLKNYLKTYKEIDIETNDDTAEFFDILYAAFKNDEKATYHQPKDLAEWDSIKTLLSHLKAPANFIGKKLKLYKFQSTRNGGVRKYLIDKEHLEKIMTTYFQSNGTE